MSAEKPVTSTDQAAARAEKFARLHAQEPLGRLPLPSGDEVKVAVRHADVIALLSDPRFSRELHRHESAPKLVSGADLGSDPDALVNMDPPRHTRVRRIISGVFTPRSMETWRPRIAQVAERLADGLLRAGPPADLVAAFAFPFPIQIIFELLGVPDTDRRRVREWSDAALTTTAGSAGERAAAAAEFRAYVRNLVVERRRQPRDGLLDMLIAAHDEDDALSEDELVRLTVSLFTAGHETTATVISRGTYSLLASGDSYAALAADPALVAPAVEEILRYDSPGEGGLPRLATEEVSLPSGTIRPGECVMPMVSAANRDPNVFPDPDRLDVARTDVPHLTFGHGAHYCLGAHLARVELQTAFAALTSRFPHLRLVRPPEEIPWTTGLIRRPETLEVTW